MLRLFDLFSYELSDLQRSKIAFDKSILSINAKECTGISPNQDYVKKICDVSYKLNVHAITRPKLMTDGF